MTASLEQRVRRELAHARARGDDLHVSLLEGMLAERTDEANLRRTIAPTATPPRRRPDPRPVPEPFPMPAPRDWVQPARRRWWRRNAPRLDELDRLAALCRLGQ